MLHIKTENYNLTIDEQQGKILSLFGNNKELCNGNEIPLFKLHIIEENYSEKVLSAKEFSFVEMIKEENNYHLFYQADGFHAEVQVCCLDADIRWRIKVSNQTNALIECVDFPGISVPNDVNGGDTGVLWDYNEGVIVENMADKECHAPYCKASYPSCGNYSVFPNMVQSQYLAYLYDNGGLYIGCHDKKYNVKQIDFYVEGDRLTLLTRLFTGICYGDSFETDYDIVWSFFNGGWQSACDIYKSWYVSVTDVKTIQDNEMIPDWYHQSPLVVTFPIRGEHDMDEMKPNNFYPYDNILKIATEVSKKANSKLLILLMHWEGSAPWAPPHVWPPYGGEEAFKEFSQKLHEMGHYLGVYCSGFGWTQQSNILPTYNREEDFKARDLQSEMTLSPKQELLRSYICQGQRFGYDFCPTSKQLKDILVWEVEQMHNAGIDYVQLLDQNHGGNSYFCYAKNHGHPHSPGAWQVEAVNDILSSVQRGKMLFGCESAAAEPFLKHLLFSDNRWEINDKIGIPVPAYAYVYHERVNNFMGNQIGVTFYFSEHEYRYRHAYSFLAGDMPTIVLDNDLEIARFWGLYWGLPGCGDIKTDQDSAYALVKELCAWRRTARNYLCYGTMEKALAFSCDKIIAMPHLRAKDEILQVPAVVANAFHFNGMRANIFVNYTTEEAEIDIADMPKGRIYVSAENYVNKCSSDITTNVIKIKPLSVVLLESEL